MTSVCRMSRRGVSDPPASALCAGWPSTDVAEACVDASRYLVCLTAQAPRPPGQALLLHYRLSKQDEGVSIHRKAHCN
jgi:hypothetical protein